MATIIYTDKGKTRRKRAFKTDKKAQAFINKHGITEYDDEFGYRHIKIGG